MAPTPAKRPNRPRKRKRARRGSPADAWVAGALGVAVLMAAEILFQLIVYPTRFNPLTSTLVALADAAVIMLPYWVMRGRWRLTVILPLVAVPLFLMANVMYYHHYEGIIPFSALLSPWGVEGAEAQFSADCLIFIIPPAVYLLFVALWWRRIATASPLPLRQIAAVAVLTITLMAAGQYQGFRAIRDYYAAHDYPVSARGVLSRMYLSYYAPSEMYADVGLPVYVVKSALGEAFISRRILNYTANDREEIADYLAEVQRLRDRATPPAVNARGKNLIIIVAESLNAEVIDARLVSEEVTPTLNALYHANDALSCLTMVPQVSTGGVEDALLIINTGMLPLTDGSYAERYPGHAMRSIATVGSWRDAVELTVRNRHDGPLDAMSRQYGMKALYDISDLAAEGLDPQLMGSDGALMELAARKARTLAQPFLIEVVTQSMQAPFVEVSGDGGRASVTQMQGSIAESELANLDAVTRSYYQACRYFDRQLTLLIESLKRHGLHSNTVIVVVSSRRASLADVGYNPEADAGYGVFIASGAGVGRDVPRVVGQVDVYPTLLDVMGIDASTCGWGGLGVSMLNPCVSSAVDARGALFGTPEGGYEALQRRTWNVSSLMLRGNYFAR